jgi:CRISPR-associated endonuclease/helicase Cas3
VVDNDALLEWFTHARIEPHERLRESTKQAISEIKELAKEAGTEYVVLLTAYGTVEWHTLDDLVQSGFSKLAYATVVFDTNLKGLSAEGILSHKSTRTEKLDVADIKRTRARFIVQQNGTAYRVDPLALQDEGDLSFEFQQDSLQLAKSVIASHTKKSLVQFVQLSTDNESQDTSDSVNYLLLMAERGQSTIENPDTAVAIRQPSIDDHCNLAEQWASRFADTLTLDPPIRDALVIAARMHDLGKNRRLWQRSIYNNGPVAYAKSGTAGMNGRMLGGYRHELGSLLDASKSSELQHYPERELALHLIAVHHGWARPHFLTNAHDMESTTLENELTTQEAMRRFGKLQLRLGRWGLAWLECLIRCSDVLASHEAALEMAGANSGDDKHA